VNFQTINLNRSKIRQILVKFGKLIKITVAQFVNRFKPLKKSRSVGRVSCIHKTFCKRPPSLAMYSLAEFVDETIGNFFIDVYGFEPRKCPPYLPWQPWVIKYKFSALVGTKVLYFWLGQS